MIVHLRFSCIYRLRSFTWSESHFPQCIEGIEFDIQTSAFSKSKSGILNTERTCAIFTESGMPIVFALRKDFPTKNETKIKSSCRKFGACCMFQGSAPFGVQSW